MYTVEFQKKGLPHAHILLWFDGEKKLRTPTDIDGVISAKLLDAILYPKLSKAVTTYMIHGPCGVSRISLPCMINGRCSKFYPKKFKLLTTIDEDGYAFKIMEHSFLKMELSWTIEMLCHIAHYYY